ncbi:hypothetical protein BKK79_12050 [Cupriavidus sp. USMAA2-4]|uniref:NYN domain-containing protein n=1 Tax=Cupriavidus sp. USMAA2-4 TaxID=876364 RepID=UPI0008A6C00E|nr:NYN domain-containing protein [Cupriavidus sp. USMAA2-4]AOY92430.1 hypothetical protein BKK79_12050 [Cupriavidus sp. USMAA2-4]
MTNSPRQGSATLAVLIDADNAAPAIVEGLLAEVAKYGVAAVKRIYGDWTKPNLAGWKERLLSHSIQPIQQFRYTVGKNATDSAMIIDAMDLLYTGRFDGFCIVSSDSDFTRLASRIREQGLIVYGFGERKTPKPFVTACDKFIYSDVLRADAETDEAAAPAKRRSGGELRQDSRLVRLLQSASQAVSDEDGWATLGGIGSHIAKQAPEFDSRNYGYGKLSELVVATGLFEVETRNGGNNKTIWVRLKKRSRNAPESEGKAQAPAQPAAPQHGGHARGEGRGPDRHGAQQRQAPSPAPAPEAAAIAVVPALQEPEEAPLPAVVPEAAPIVPAEAAAEPEAGIAAPADAGEPPAEAVPAKAKAAGRPKRAPKRPDVVLSETPWPIDATVFAAPGATVLTAGVPGEELIVAAPVVEAAAETEVVGEAAPVKKKRAAAPRKRAVKKVAE